MQCIHVPAKLSYQSLTLALWLRPRLWRCRASCESSNDLLQYSHTARDLPIDAKQQIDQRADIFLKYDGQTTTTGRGISAFSTGSAHCETSPT